VQRQAQATSIRSICKSERPGPTGRIQDRLGPPGLVRKDLLHGLEHALLPERFETDFRRREVNHLHRPGLPQAMDAHGALLEARRIPGRLGNAAGDTAQIDFRGPALPFPLFHQAAQDVALLPVRLRLI